MSTVAVVGWADTDFVALVWPEAEDLDPAVLTSYLQAAYEQCVAFLPDVPVPTPLIVTAPPERYVQAQIMQARALYRSNVAGPGDQLAEGQAVTVFPMDWTVKNLLRPKKIGRVL